MIEPVQRGPELLAALAATPLKAGSVQVCWLGQSGFLIRCRSGTLVIDPYLSDHLTRKYAGTDRPHIRMTRAPLAGDDLTSVDLILASHQHSDHLDPGTLPALLAASPDALLGLPAPLIDHARGLGLPADRLLGLAAGDTVSRGGFDVQAIPSAHEGLDTDAAGRHLYLGFVIEAEGRRLYHGGDTLAYDGLVSWLGPGPFDVLFLPINGRDPARGVPGNMSAAEAIALAEQVRPRYLVPHHYDMFTFNTVPVSTILDEAHRLSGDVSVRILQCGEPWEITR